VLLEIRRVATFVALGNEFDERMKKTELHRHMGVVFHGDPNKKSSAPYCEQICKGIGSFVGIAIDLFDKEAAKITSADASDSCVVKFYLKEELLLDKSRRFSVGPDASFDINPKVLSVKTVNSKEIITGKTLHNEATSKVLLNCKKALSHAKVWLNDDGSLPSGKCKADYITHIRNAMYCELKNDGENDKPVVEIDGVNSDSDSDDRADDSHVDEQEAPKDWIFEGWLTFFVVGPLSNDPTKLLSTKDPAEKSSSNNRQAFRKKQLEGKQEKRSCMAASQLDAPLGSRGYSMQENLTVARMWQHDIQQQHRVLADKIHAIQIQLASLQEEAKLAAESARATGETCDWNECRELRQQCAKKRKEIEDLSKESDKVSDSELSNKLQSFFMSMASTPRKQAKTTSDMELESSTDGEQSSSLTDHT